MGYSIFLKAKTRDTYKEEQLLLFEENGSTDLSNGFTSFVTRDFENSEQMQIEHILDTDLSVLRRRPVNLEPDTGELEYRLFVAEEEAEEEQAADIRIQIKQMRTDWEATYDQIQDGWTPLTEMQQVVKSLLIEIENQPDFDRRLTPAEGWDNYFSSKPRQGYWDVRFTDDLYTILMHLDYMQAIGIEYVAMVGM